MPIHSIPRARLRQFRISKLISRTLCVFAMKLLERRRFEITGADTLRRDAADLRRQVQGTVTHLSPICAVGHLAMLLLAEIQITLAVRMQKGYMAESMLAAMPVSPCLDNCCIQVGCFSELWRRHAQRRRGHCRRIRSLALDAEFQVAWLWLALPPRGPDVWALKPVRTRLGG